MRTTIVKCQQCGAVVNEGSKTSKAAKNKIVVKMVLCPKCLKESNLVMDGYDEILEQAEIIHSQVECLPIVLTFVIYENGDVECIEIEEYSYFREFAATCSDARDECPDECHAKQPAINKVAETTMTTAPSGVIKPSRVSNPIGDALVVFQPTTNTVTVAMVKNDKTHVWFNRTTEGDAAFVSLTVIGEFLSNYVGDEI
jgi:hypothetical protein